MKKSQPITKNDLESVITKLEKKINTQIDHASHSFHSYTADLASHFYQSQMEQSKNFEKMLQEHHDTFIEAIETIVISDSIKPLELRVAILESKKI